MERKKPNNVTMQKKFLTAIKDTCTINDLMILKKTSYWRACALKKEIREFILKDEGKICPYPMPMKKVLEVLDMNIKDLELSALREKKMGIPIEPKKMRPPSKVSALDSFD